MGISNRLFLENLFLKRVICRREMSDFLDNLVAIKVFYYTGISIGNNFDEACEFLIKEGHIKREAYENYKRQLEFVERIERLEGYNQKD